MTELKLIKGGHFTDPDEIPTPNKPIEEWTEEEKEAYYAVLWNMAEAGTFEYGVKNLKAPIEAIELTVMVLEEIKRLCNESAAAAGYDWNSFATFHGESASNLLQVLHRRLRERV